MTSKYKTNVSRSVGNPAPIIYASEIVGFGCSDLHVATIPVWLARLVISHFHYSKRVVNNSYLHLGIFEGRDLVGVMQWGYAMNPSSASKIVTGTGNRQYMELNRLWVHDRMPRNTESRSISYALKTIKLLHPEVEWVQTFADERCGRFGVVYQACNFDYVGSHKSTFYELDGEWYHKISLTTKKSKAGVRGKHLQENFSRATAHTFNQFRYIRFLNKRAKRRLNTKLFKPQPYPKPENGKQ
ncbi:protein mom [Pectobacterium parmentieri]|uniref:Mom family adenine methylcarbamoylation protein n=1 Tax=Pectobacterium parmentieri TaxID=1905730 RepID=UPI000EAF8BBB|nr:protein mom [Pectobacterium parmentieri]AYH32983.1 protein mom [Pectobacterium parmentieri]